MIPIGNFFFDVIGAKLVAGTTMNQSVATVTTIGIGLESYTSTNFGFFSEYAITWRSTAQVIISDTAVY